MVGLSATNLSSETATKRVIGAVDVGRPKLLNCGGKGVKSPVNEL